MSKIIFDIKYKNPRLLAAAKAGLLPEDDVLVESFYGQATSETAARFLFAMMFPDRVVVSVDPITEDDFVGKYLLDFQKAGWFDDAS